MSKNYVARRKLKKDPNVHNTSHVTVNTKTTTKDIPKVSLCISIVKNVVTYDNI
jgi:hypothetical protein